MLYIYTSINPISLFSTLLKADPYHYFIMGGVIRIAGIEPSMGCLKDNCFTIKQYSLIK